MNRWQTIWNSKKSQYRIIDGDTFQNFLYLKGQMGINTYQGDMAGAEQFIGQFMANTAKMRGIVSLDIQVDAKKESYFEVGCGSGAYLYYLSCQSNSSFLGGMDYSKPLIETAKQALSSQNILSEIRELYCTEAINMKTDEKYDYVFSRSVFQYFPNAEYGLKVAEKMISKALCSVGIFDLFNLSTKEDFLEYRRSIIEDYDVKYADTPHQFYTKEMFLTLAERYNCDILFSRDALEGYWNEPFVFDVYLYKREC